MLFGGKKNVGRNVKMEMASGKSQKQSVAIALDVARRKKKKKPAAGPAMQMMRQMQ